MTNIAMILNIICGGKSKLLDVNVAETLPHSTASTPRGRHLPALSATTTSDGDDDD